MFFSLVLAAAHMGASVIRTVLNNLHCQLCQVLDFQNIFVYMKIYSKTKDCGHFARHEVKQ
jgi:hypothetical protein